MFFKRLFLRNFYVRIQHRSSTAISNMPIPRSRTGTHDIPRAMDSSPKVKETLERVVYDKDTAPVSLEPVLDAVKETVISALESLGLTAEGSPNVAHEVETFGEAHDTGTRPEQNDTGTRPEQSDTEWPIDKTELQNGDTKHLYRRRGLNSCRKSVRAHPRPRLPS